MRLILALFLPFTVFFTIGRPFAGVFCFLLQVTILGWIPASIWAVYALGQYKTDQKIKQALAKAQ
ncbi:YqaE/Pmp3 family membrane protein [Roseateles sp.]|uniref:YqaE/Pmp3 family membrane protein n=1 Tax=Roseateles sp. TaxID=1971397 RepID=UPI003BA44FBA